MVCHLVLINICLFVEICVCHLVSISDLGFDGLYSMLFHVCHPALGF